ncbi:hypothetical protein PtB15_14B129 [Puccinia triticina]|nr:hypothetical protein PtB15_14B129 [Puccinia triticina]
MHHRGHPFCPQHPAQSRRRPPRPATHPKLLALTKPSGQFKLLARKNERSPRAIFSTTEVIRAVLNTQPSLADALLALLPIPSSLHLPPQSQTRTAHPTLFPTCPTSFAYSPGLLPASSSLITN